MASCSSWASLSARLPSPSIWRGLGNRRRKVGRRFCATTPTGLPRWTYSWSQQSLFSLLYGLLILKHGRREILWLAATAHPSAEWISRQLMEAYGWEQGPCYLIRDRDRVYGEVFIRRLRAMGIRDRPTAPRSPWQNGYCERLIGSIRRECLDHIVVFGERHLRHLLRVYANYYNRTRTHLSLHKDSPTSRAVESFGRILPVPILGGLHHQYVRI
jgi:transposase InsO family protein